MQTQKNSSSKNARVTTIQIETINDHGRVTKLSSQKVDGKWVQFKRVVHTLH